MKKINFAKAACRLFVLVLILVALWWAYNRFWLSDYESKVYPVEKQPFHFIIARGSDEARQDIDVSSAVVPQNYINIASWAGQVNGHIYFKLLRKFPDEYPAFSIQLLNLTTYSDKTGVFGRTFISKKIDQQGNNLRVFLNSSAMEINESYRFEFELWYNKTFSKKYYITFQDAIINLTGFSYGKEYVCESECFVVYEQGITSRPIIPLPFPEDKVRLLNSKSFEVSNSRLTFWFSPKSRTMELRSKIIDDVTFGVAASVIYGLLVNPIIMWLFKNKQSKQIVLLKQGTEQKAKKRQRSRKKKAASRKT